jgi:hypothetical protein
VTFEHKIVVGLNDIKAVIFECANAKCRARLSVFPDKIQIPAKCQNCNEAWIDHRERKSFLDDSSQQTNFIKALSNLRMLEENGAPFKILLEFDDSKATA